MLRGLLAWSAANGHLYPKHHAAFHLARQAAWHGTQTSTDKDETFHRICKRIYHSANAKVVGLLAKHWILMNVRTFMP